MGNRQFAYSACIIGGALMKKKSKGLPCAWGAGVFLLLSSFVSLVPAAQQSLQANAQDDELDEVVVSAAKKIKSQQAMLSWLQRLIGHYSYEGYIELSGEGAPQGRHPASGAGKCVPFADAVLCTMQVRWPDIKADDGTALIGGTSNLSPAMVLYGFDWNVLGIRSQLVDNQGMAHGGLGELRGNTLITSTGCVDLPGDCKRVSRVDAQPDGKMIQMEIDIERDAVRVSHQVFQLRRVAAVSRQHQ